MALRHRHRLLAANPAAGSGRQPAIDPVGFTSISMCGMYAFMTMCDLRTCGCS